METPLQLKSYRKCLWSRFVTILVLVETPLQSIEELVLEALDESQSLF